jgi:hypothetical protein
VLPARSCLARCRRHCCRHCRRQVVNPAIVPGPAPGHLRPPLPPSAPGRRKPVTEVTIPSKVKLERGVGELEGGRTGRQRREVKGRRGGARRERAVCVLVSQILQFSKPAPSGGSLGRLESARDSTEPGSLSGRGLPRSLPAAARSPPLFLQAARPPRRALPRSRAPSPCAPPPHLRRAGNAWPRRGPPGGGGRPCWGRGQPWAARPGST